MAKIWNLKGELQGILRQGYMLKQNYVWNFPLGTYQSDLGKRQNGVQNMLNDVRKRRDEERSMKKTAVSTQFKPGQTAFGFAGA